MNEKHEHFLVMAHCGGRFDFQLLYEYYLSSDCIRQGRDVKPPLMKGQKITAAFLPYNIKLVDLYNFVSRPLSALPAVFGLENTSKGDFPHLFNCPEFQHYIGPIPAIEWYDPDTKSSQKTQ